MDSQHPMEYLPAYVLEALDAETLQRVHLHVLRCSVCQQEVVMLQSELTVAGPPLRPAIKEQVMRRAVVDLALRDAIQIAARRASMRWLIGALLLICGSVVASLLMWSGMDQRALLAQDSTQRREVAYTESAMMAQLLGDPAVVQHTFIGYDEEVAPAVLYAHPVSGVLIIVRDLPAMTARDALYVWRGERTGVVFVGRFAADDDGVAWMVNADIAACSQRTECRYWITRESEPYPPEPSGQLLYELVMP
jgi:hypothetical protein